MEKEKSDQADIHTLFNGELVIKSDGIYTYAHFYGHPLSKMELVLVGINHGGDTEYYRQILDVLNHVQLVFYEGSPPIQTESTIDDERQQDLQNLFSENLDEAFYSSLRLYFREASDFLELSTERDSFDYSKHGWISGDKEFISSLSEADQQKFMEDLKNRLGLVPFNRKESVVEYVKRNVDLIKSGEFTKKDFGDGFVFFVV